MDEQGRIAEEMGARRQIKALFDGEIARAEADSEPSTFVAWLTGLRDRTLALVPEEADDANEQ